MEQSATNNKLDKRSSKIKFEFKDDERFQDCEVPEETATRSSNLEDDMAICEPDPDDSNIIEGDDKTSADYYFDSYSHFGTIFFSSFSVLFGPILN